MTVAVDVSAADRLRADPANFVPASEAEFKLAMADPLYRLNNLYWIVTKEEEGEGEGLVVKFKLNEAQSKLAKRLWYRNIVPKARQLGVTTFSCILALDYALFTPNFQAGIIAHTDPAAKKIFRDKVLFAYEHLPEAIRAAMPLKKQSAEELVFANDSSILVSTSMRGGTIHFLHVSEFGKICARFPHRAREIVTGSLPAVPRSGIAIIESTAEGRDGDFYTMTMRAKAHADAGKKLTQKDYRLHFFPWYEGPDYQMDPAGVVITDKDHDYFDELEAKLGIMINTRQRAWYCATRDEDFSGDQQKMWQEYPSCVSGDTYVSTLDGMVRIKDIEVDGRRVLAKFDQGVKPAFKVETTLGYTIVCTEDHKILCPDGEFRELRNLKVGDEIQLGRPQFGVDYKEVTYWPNRFAPSSILIDEDLALFIGVYMGDGSFSRDTVSIVCASEDHDMVEHVSEMLSKYISTPTGRYVGSNNGGYELRSSSVEAKEPLFALGLVKVRESGGYTRNVHVPEYIMQSPKGVVAAFLRGIFETDGFACRKGTSIKLFSKYEHFVKDIQLLLLGFGIEARVSRHIKRGGPEGQYEYVGYELALRADGVRKFAPEIGFMSIRKQARAEMSLTKRRSGSHAIFNWTDAIAAIQPVGDIHVYDIMTDTHQFNAAGIEVHNCVEECFMVSSEGCYYTRELTIARRQGRILERLPSIPSVPCWTFWDIGNSDGTAIWVMQKVGQEYRCIRFYEEWGEPYNHAVQWLQSLGLTWDTMYLPHDADHIRQGQNVNKSPKQMLEELMPGVRFEIVPRIQDINWGIQQMRDVFPMLWFDETECKEGIIHLESYRKKWNQNQERWGDQPDKAGGHSEAADALRQFAQAYAGGLLNIHKTVPKRRRKDNWRVV